MNYDNISLSINMEAYLIMTKVKREITKLEDLEDDYIAWI